MGYLGATLTQVFARARAERTCHNSPHWKRGYGVRVTSRTGRARRIWGDFEKSVSWELDTEQDGWFSLARGDLCGGCHTCWWGGGDEKASIERLCLSPYVEEPLNSKVIKSFVPEQRSRHVFFEVWDSYVLCIYVMNVPCTFRIFMYMAMVHFDPLTHYLIGHYFCQIL